MMAQTFSHTLFGPGDAPVVRLSDDGLLGCSVAVDLMRGETKATTLLWNNGSYDSVTDTVNAFVQWLDSLAAEAKLAASDWVNGVGEGPF
jgi:hypothetical protein